MHYTFTGSVRHLKGPTMVAFFDLVGALFNLDEFHRIAFAIGGGRRVFLFSTLFLLPAVVLLMEFSIMLVSGLAFAGLYFARRKYGT